MLAAVKYLHVVRLSSQNAFSGIGVFLLSLSATLLHCVPLFGVYAVAFASRGGMLNGTPYASAVWIIGAYNFFWALGARYLYADFVDQIRSGAVETWINKPAQYVFFMIAQRLGRNISIFFLHSGLMITLCLLYVGLPPVDMTPTWWLQLVTLFVMGNTLAFGLFALVGLTAFWLEDAQPVMWVVDKFIMVLGGAYVPTVILPTVLRTFAERSPFGAILVYNQVFSPDFPGRFPVLFGSQLVWAAIVWLTLWVAWKLAVKKLNVNGG